MTSSEHKKYMALALAEARAALAANEFPVGCVLVHGGRVVARGRRQNSRGSGINELDHAELNALRELTSRKVTLDFSEITVYATMEPCLMCFAALLLHDIRSVVFAYEDAMGGGTSVNLSHLTPLYRERPMQVEPHICRAESLELFKTFFRNPANGYWRNSFLAEYTLSQ